MPFRQRVPYLPSEIIPPQVYLPLPPDPQNCSKLLLHPLKGLMIRELSACSICSPKHQPTKPPTNQAQVSVGFLLALINLAQPLNIGLILKTYSRFHLSRWTQQPHTKDYLYAKDSPLFCCQVWTCPPGSTLTNITAHLISTPTCSQYQISHAPNRMSRDLFPTPYPSFSTH